MSCLWNVYTRRGAQSLSLFDVIKHEILHWKQIGTSEKQGKLLASARSNPFRHPVALSHLSSICKDQG